MIVLRSVVLLQTAFGPFGPSDIDPDNVRDRACDVTAPSRECGPPDTTAPEVPDLPDVPNPSGGIGLLGQLLVLLLVAALLVGIIWLAKRWFDDGRLARDDGDEDDDLDESLDEPVEARVVDHETPPDRWRRLAADARAVGDHREAVRCEYRALVGDLARAGHVDEIPGRTSGEERAQISDLAPTLGERGRDVAMQFSTAADIFDSAWFDDDVVTSGHDDRFVGASRAVLDVVLSTSGARRSIGRRS